MDEADKISCNPFDWLRSRDGQLSAPNEEHRKNLAASIRTYGEQCRRAGAEAMREASIAAMREARAKLREDDTLERELLWFTGDVEIAIRSLPSAAEAASPAAGWRPIASAPKDGTEIDVWLEGPTGDGHRVVDAKHDGDRWVVFSEQWDEDVAVERNNHRITHWMPLPAAPLPSSPSEEARAG